MLIEQQFDHVVCLVMFCALLASLCYAIAIGNGILWLSLMLSEFMHD